VVAQRDAPLLWTCNAAPNRRRGRPQLPFSDDEVSVRAVLRSGGGDEDIAMVLRRSVWASCPGHGINEPGFLRPSRSMSMIGG